jgi:NAD(P)-dependent dehydrogenase (short-subunit alcohol dehydrogenase family)
MSLDQFSIAGRRALVVGADTGIGLTCARAIALAGADVVIGGMNAVEGTRNAAAIAADSKTRVRFLPVDVREEAQIEKLVADAADFLGGIDIAMNNAGITGPSGPLQDIPTKQFDDVFAINVRGVWLCMKHEIPHLLKAGKGSIINVSSGAVFTTLPFQSPYVGSKHAIAGLTKTAALELATSNVRVNAIAPGPVNTGMLDTIRANRTHLAKPPGIPMARIAEPAEMTGVVLWLASDASSYVTGTIVAADGGLSAQ